MCQNYYCVGFLFCSVRNRPRHSLIYGIKFCAASANDQPKQRLHDCSLNILMTNHHNVQHVTLLGGTNLSLNFSTQTNTNEMTQIKNISFRENHIIVYESSWQTKSRKRGRYIDCVCVSDFSRTSASDIHHMYRRNCFCRACETQISLRNVCFPF